MYKLEAKPSAPVEFTGLGVITIFDSVLADIEPIVIRGLAFPGETK